LGQDNGTSINVANRYVTYSPYLTEYKSAYDMLYGLTMLNSPSPFLSRPRPLRALISLRSPWRLSFAVPFEEDERDPRTFFLDLDYVEEMWRMFRKVNGISPSYTF
jgi:hypothetical protein